MLNASGCTDPHHGYRGAGAITRRRVAYTDDGVAQKQDWFTSKRTYASPVVRQLTNAVDDSPTYYALVFSRSVR